jgi:hypothetical protein
VHTDFTLDKAFQLFCDGGHKILRVVVEQWVGVVAGGMAVAVRDGEGEGLEPGGAAFGVGGEERKSMK